MRYPRVVRRRLPSRGRAEAAGAYPRAVQRLFSSFPSGAVGTGLVLLRAVLALQVLIEGVAGFAASSAGDRTGFTVAAVWILCGCAILPGVLTPLVPIVVATGAVYTLGAGLAAGGVPPVTPTAWWWPALFQFVLAVSLALLGPGAYSVDARLFGRREIVLKPHQSRALPR